MFLSILLVILTLIIFDRLKPKKLLQLHSELGNDSIYLPFIGHAHHFIGTNEDRMRALMKGARMAYKRKHGAVSFWIGNNLFVAISDIDQANTIIKSNNDKSFTFNVTKHLMGKGIIFAPLDEWHRRRKIQVPTFAPKYVTKFIKIFEDQSKVIVDKLESKVGKGNISLWDYIPPYALDSICETTFGVNIDMQRQPDHPFLKSFPEYFTNLVSFTAQPWLKIEALYDLLPISSKQEKLREIIKDFIDNVIREKKASMAGKYEEMEHKNGISNKDDKVIYNELYNTFKLINFARTDTDERIKTSLELMIENSTDIDKGFTSEELREEVLAFALAGTDTTSAGLSYAVVLLSQHPEVQEKVYKEIFDIFGDSNRPIEFKDLYKLKYMEAVVKETLRLYPPIPLFYRSYINDTALPSGLIMPEGCTILINIWGIHHNPKYWGSDADDFRPERFLQQGPVPNAFMPFGYGPRNCIGSQYAMLSMKTALTTILRRYRIKPATSFTYGKDNPLRVSYDVIMRHVDNFEVQIEERI